MKDKFLLSDDIIFLNHGSFGSCPREVFAVYQQWQQQVEQQPVLFLGREINNKLEEARTALGNYLGAAADDLVFVPNSTHGVNIVAHSLQLQVGDEILATDHEYGACDRMWEILNRRTGARYIKQPLSVPCSSQEELLEQLWSGVTSRTKLIFISHITSATALHLPVAEICRRAREAGIMTLIDGSHGPALLDLNLTELGADFYTGNCHKWLCSPKGAGFLYVRRDFQHLVQPLVISWGDQAKYPTGNIFLDEFQWTGTADPSAFLSVPAAIDFQKRHDWQEVRERCRQLAKATKQRLCALPGVQSLYSDDKDLYFQFFAVQLPPCNTTKLKEQLYDQYGIEVVVQKWQERPLLRVSVQAYNTEAEMDVLLEALTHLLPETAL
jgi:isopenicillin-N epimerase